MSFKIAVMGLGNIGRFAVETLEKMPDGECIGVVRRPASLGRNAISLRNVPDFGSIQDLISAQGRPDAVLVCAPSREVPGQAEELLRAGLCTVDSFDIHARMTEVVDRLGSAALEGKAVAITAAGWDPGSDSVLRALFEAMVPSGVTFTNFGRGRSMGHSVAARAIPGVADATSITIPLGGGRHSRLVYVVPEEGACMDKIRAAIAADAYFASDPLEVREVTAAELPFVADASHGVLLERVGASGLTSNQHLNFDMRINNPALTAQILVSCARAAVRLREKEAFGSYTMIDIPPVLMLPGERMSNVARLV